MLPELSLLVFIEDERVPVEEEDQRPGQERAKVLREGFI